MTFVRYAVFFALVCHIVTDSQGFVLVPEEIQSILQLAYSFFPTINTGTSNSKIGVGFRLGKNADAQVLLEIGPESSGLRRRQVSSWRNKASAAAAVQPTTTTEASKPSFESQSNATLNNTIED